MVHETRKEGEVLEKVLSQKTGRNVLKKPPVIEIKNVKKVYRMGSERISAVDDVSFEIDKGEFCCLLGTSGSGKSTLLNLMAGIEKASGGQILIKGKNIRKMSEKQLAKFRQKYLGFVFQSYNLLNSMTALENVEFPLVFKRIPARKRKRLAKDMLTKVGLGSRINHRPKQMSGGQQQRVGIARAFVAKPEIVFADEPTGNLDTRTTMEVMKLIKQIARDNNQTIVMVTHDPRLADFADKIIHILDGKIQSVEMIEHPIDEFEAAGGKAQSPQTAEPAAQETAAAKASGAETSEKAEAGKVSDLEKNGESEAGKSSGAEITGKAAGKKASEAQKAGKKAAKNTADAETAEKTASERTDGVETAETAEEAAAAGAANEGDGSK